MLVKKNVQLSRLFYGVQDVVSRLRINLPVKGDASFCVLSLAVGTNDKTINSGELSNRAASSRPAVIAEST